ncbi:MAG: DUF445 family protein [Burkholderiales bacterium]|nr:DUF445 family protein [Burkholderiales bacterium]
MSVSVLLNWIIIPLVGGLVGWFTNWLAVKMIMQPIHYVGWRPFGWQGIVPANSAKMARTLINNSLSKIVSQKELLERVDPDDLARVIQRRIDPHVVEIVDSMIEKTSLRGLHVTEFAWAMAPKRLRAMVYSAVHARLPEIIGNFIVDVRKEAGDLMDINALITERLSSESELLVDLFNKACDKEFQFIARSGFYLGVPLGIPVIFIWVAYPVWWVLPVFGALVGYVTNWLALYMVFRPLEPKRVWPFTFQGLFLKRQKAVAAAYGEFFANHLITAEVLTNEVVSREASVRRIQELIQREISTTVDDFRFQFKPLAMATLGVKQFKGAVDFAAGRALDLMHPLDKDAQDLINTALQIESTLSTRLGELPVQDFHDLLHPVVEEDEWKLILIGGVLGFVAGLIQWWLM